MKGSSSATPPGRRPKEVARNTEQNAGRFPEGFLEKKWRHQLGKYIRDSRILHGWTQRELAEKLRISGFRRCSRELLSQIESGCATIRGHEVYYLRDALGKAFEREFWRPYYIRNVGMIDCEKESDA